MSAKAYRSSSWSTWLEEEMVHRGY